MEPTRQQVDRLLRTVDLLREDGGQEATRQLVLATVFLRHVAGKPDDALGRPTWEHLKRQLNESDACGALRTALHAWSGTYGSLQVDLRDESDFVARSSRDHQRAESALRGLVGVLDTMDLPARELYEECLARFSEDRAGGEYFTPREVVKTMVELVEPRPTEEIYDPACGSAGLLIAAADLASRQNSEPADVRTPRLAGRDIRQDNLKIAAMNLILHGLESELPRGLELGNSLSFGSWPSEHYDIVLANPPFGVSRWQERLDRRVTHGRYGEPPKNHADFAWAQHVLGSLKPAGRAAVLLANGATFRAGAEHRIRAGLVQDDVLAAVIQLPPGIFPHTRIPACLWIFSKGKQDHIKGRFLFVDAQKMGVQVSRTKRALTQGDVTQVVRTFRDWSEGRKNDEPGWCTEASLEEIEAADYNLLPARYVRPAATVVQPGDSERRVRELTEELYKHFEESSRLEHEIRDVLGDF
ncbi:N-6 DNA methylase [Actinomadura nitritigenes]|uniref:N-6 DNA methylase n=1 Tax=Actinomadura nitritigenes TaxID=134602 RepID=UPI003D8ED20F